MDGDGLGIPALPEASPRRPTVIGNTEFYELDDATPAHAGASDANAALSMSKLLADLELKTARIAELEEDVHRFEEKAFEIANAGALTRNVEGRREDWEQLIAILEELERKGETTLRRLKGARTLSETDSF